LASHYLSDFLCCWSFCRFRYKLLKDPEYLEKYGEMYAGLKIKRLEGDDRKVLWQPAFFVLRRLLFAVLAVFFKDNYNF